ncbi:glycoside hydrolase family 2 TIM barrel-domain containing protein [Paraglaciecola hydrolytica]|uniref:Glycoside hydrolase family 2 catalytic domain-containing protein n=1 Tax=Paraglaciecola hydrolytica TaxID=1799789 RepID=A0A148KKQ7_9ALTE|nr:glycoside hydrolase family 2 TIM barrel-domain containing protein [Paraglaciecola hydrolytica]KXI26886.1 hypothetical protein AX660_03740 [Paraglaciecola hydrolytica]
MPLKLRGVLLALFCLLAACQPQTSENVDKTLSTNVLQAIPSTLKFEQGRYQIYRGDSPYFIKGAGGSSNLPLLAASGGNSVRTWGTDKAQQVLDGAHANGLTVMLGLRIGHERHGFDYDDKAAVAEQKEAVREQILKFKDHPALLVWGIGNEVDLFYTNTNVWYAIEDIASMIKELDPNHLVTTVTAGIDKTKADFIKERVPSIDYLSINIYGGLENLPQHLLDIAYQGAYVVTEWGPTGHWQIAKTDWDVPIEQTSTEKAASYRSRYAAGIAAAPERALGSYAFLWGQKQETTPTWYGVFTEAGEPTEVVDSLQYLWTGQWPEQRAPAITSFRLNGKPAADSVHVNLGQTNEAEVELIQHDEQGLSIRWEILAESTDIKAGGDRESRPQALSGLIVAQQDNKLTFTTPAEPGAYRLFMYATNPANKVANANIPFYVDVTAKN